MQIKKDLVSHMETNHPDFKFAWTSESICYNFCRLHADGLYDFILFVKDRSRCVLSLEIATTYDPFWKGELTWRTAKAKGLAFVKHGKNSLRAEQTWYAYGNSKEELSIALAEISHDLRLHAMNFFDRSAQELHSDQLLQYGFSLVRDWKPLEENFRAKLEADWLGGRLKENPFYSTFMEVETCLQNFAINTGLPTEDIRGYTIDLLKNFRRPGWSWENSRL
ncbi:MAG: hypothetical protein ACLPYZ_06030 [Limisphaerales bacterium]